MTEEQEFQLRADAEEEEFSRRAFEEEELAQKRPPSAVDPFAVAGYRTLQGLPFGLGDKADNALGLLTGRKPEDVDAFFEQLGQESPTASNVGSALGVANAFVTDPLKALGLMNKVPALGRLTTPLSKLFDTVKGGKAVNRTARIAQGSLTGGADAALREDATLDDVKTGFGLGAILPGFLEGGQAVLGGKMAANRAAVKALRPTAGQAGTMNAGQAQNVGRALLDQGVVTPFAARSTIQKRLGSAGSLKTATQEGSLPSGALGEVGRNLGGYLNRADDAAKGAQVINRRQVAGRVRDKIGLNPQTTDFPLEQKALNEKLLRMTEGGDLSIKEAQAVKKIGQDKLNMDKAKDSQLREAMDVRVDRAERDVLAEEISAQQARFSPNEAKAYKQSAKDYAGLIKASKIINKTVDREGTVGSMLQGGVIPGLGIAGTIGFAARSPVTSGAILTAATLLAGQRRYGSQMAASGLNKDFNTSALTRGAMNLWQHLKDKEEQQ